MAGKADGPDLEVAPAGLFRQIGGQAPLWLPSPDSPPGEDQTANFLCLEDSQLRGLGRVGIRGGDALAGCIELISMEGTDEPATAYTPSRGRPQIGAQGVGNKASAAHTRPFASHQTTSVLPHPSLLDELCLQDRLTACDEVPTLGKETNAKPSPLMIKWRTTIPPP